MIDYLLAICIKPEYAKVRIECVETVAACMIPPGEQYSNDSNECLRRVKALKNRKRN